MKKEFYVPLPLFFIIIATTFCFSQQREVLPVKLSMISERLYQILEGRGANGGLYVGDDAVLVIDAKMDQPSVDQCITEIKKITDKPIKYLINTHSDGDHVNGNQFFPPSVTIIAHENCRKDFFHPKRDGTPSDWIKPELQPFIPALTFQDRMDIYLGSKKVELWYFGIGHTTGDAVVYFPEERIAFVGDQAFIGRPQLIHSYKGGNSFEHVKTLIKMLEKIPAEKFCSGHSEIMNREMIQKHINEMRTRQEKVKDLIQKGKILAEIKKEFSEGEDRLIESIFHEIKENAR